MAVLRNTQAVQAGATQDTRRVNQAQVGAAQVNPNYTRNVGIEDNGQSARWKVDLLNNLMGTAVKVGEKYVDGQIQDAYLKGSAQAAIGASESDLESDPFTRGWAVAGFRDNMGRLTQAKQDAQLLADMPTLAQQSPEVMQEYLAKNRQELMPVLEGMSREMRTKMIPMMAIRDQSAITQHKVAHQQHIWDVKGKALTVPISKGIEQLSTIRELRQPGEAYNDATKAVAGSIVDMFSDTSLPRAQRDQLVQESVELALTGKHVGLYNLLRNQVVPDSIDDKGNFVSTKGLSMLESLPVATQEKLAKQYQTATEANKHIANQDFHDRVTFMVNDFKHTPNKWGWDQVKEMMDAGTAAGLLTQERRDTIINKYLDAQHEANGSIGAMEAYLNNDTNYMQGPNGKGIHESSKAADEGLRKLPLNEQIDRLSQAANLGTPGAGKLLGTRLQGSIMSLSVKDGKISEEHKVILEKMHKTLDAFEEHPERRESLMEGLDDQAKLRVQRLRVLNASGLTGSQAVERVLAQEKNHAMLSTQEKAVLAAEAVKADEKWLTGVGGEGALTRAARRIWSGVATVVSPTTAREAAIRGNMEGQAFDAETNQQLANRQNYLEAIRTELRAEARDMALMGNNGAADSDARMEAAMGNVMRRTVRVGPNVLIVPKSSGTPQAYFGIPVATPPEHIDRALKEYFKPQTDGGWVETIVTPKGIHYQEYDREHVPVPGRKGYAEPSKLKPLIEKQQDSNRRIVNETIGEGVKYSAGGIMFNYNGVNTAGAREADMLALRASLIKHEGVKNKPYGDGSNKDREPGAEVFTVGVGVSTKNENYPKSFRPDGTLSNEAIAESFKAASNGAAKIGMGLQDKTGLQNSAAFRLFSELAYQGLGKRGKHESTAPFIDAMRRRAPQEDVLTALRNSTAYQYSGEARRKHYEKLTLEALKG